MVSHLLRHMITDSRFVNQQTRSAQTFKKLSGKNSYIPTKHRSVRVHQKNKDPSFYELNVSELNMLLRNLRINQIYGKGNSKLYDPAIDLVKDRLYELRQQETFYHMNDYMQYCSELDRYMEIEKLNNEKEQFYLRFNNWIPTRSHENYTCEDKMVEVQVRLHEIIERCKDFEKREKAFKEQTFGKRLASRVDF